MGPGCARNSDHWEAFGRVVTGRLKNRLPAPTDISASHRATRHKREVAQPPALPQQIREAAPSLLTDLAP